MKTRWLLFLLGPLLLARAAEPTEPVRFSQDTRNTLSAPSVRAAEPTDPARFTQDTLPVPAAPAAPAGPATTQDSLRQLEAEYFAFEEQLLREGREHASNVPAQPGPERCVYEIYRSLTTPEVCETYFRDRKLRRRYGDKVRTEPYGFSAEPRGCYFIPQDSIVYALLPPDSTLADAIRLLRRREELYLDPAYVRGSETYQEHKVLYDSLPRYVRNTSELPPVQTQLIAPFRPETGLPAERVLYLPDRQKCEIATFGEAFFRKYGTLTGLKYGPFPESATERRSRELLGRLGVKCEHIYEDEEILDTFYKPGIRLYYVLLESGLKRACVQLDDNKETIWTVILVREADAWRIAAVYRVAQWVLFR